MEILSVSLWLDSEILRGRGALASIVHDWGAWGVRLGVAIVLGMLIFGESRARDQFDRISAVCAASKVRWSLLFAHGAAMTLFVWLSSIVFRQGSSAGLSNTLIVLWGITGVALLTLAACALIPFSTWIDLLRSSGDAWIYGLGAAVVACTLGILAQKLWPPLSHWTLSLVAVMLRPFVSTVIVDPTRMIVGTPTFQGEIAQTCSGYEGMGLMLAFSSAWLWFFRREWRFPQALILIPVGLGLIWILNSVRIVVLMLIGNAGWPQIAAGGFHSQAGWIIFNGIAIGTCILARRIPSLNVQQREESETSGTANPTAAYLLPFLTILGAAMIARALSSDFEWFYPLRVVAAAGTIWYFRRSYRGAHFGVSWPGFAAGTLVLAMWLVFEPATRTTEPAALAHASQAVRTTWITFRVIGGVLVVPIAEELAFRGFLLRRLASSDFESVSWTSFAWAPFLISSAAFGLLHGERWIEGILAGAIFAYAQMRKGRIGDAIVAHAIANGGIAVLVLAHSAWQLW